MRPVVIAEIIDNLIPIVAGLVSVFYGRKLKAKDQDRPVPIAFLNHVPLHKAITIIGYVLIACFGVVLLAKLGGM